MDEARRFWERQAASYDRSMRLLGGPMPRTLELVAEVTRGADRALEIACGTGLVTAAVAPGVRELLATDYADAMVEQTRARMDALGLSNVRCEPRDVYALGEPAESFDAVIAANVLHLVPDLERALAAMHEVLRPGGRLVVPTFCHDENAVSRLVSWGMSWVAFPASRRFDLAGLVTAVERGGFTVDCREAVPGLLPVGFVAGRRG